MIRFEEVTKVYPTANGEVRAIDGVSLEVAEGEFIAVRGPSGCGKSTLLALAGGLARPTSGLVEVAGANLATMGPADLARFRVENIGFVFQMFHLLPYLSVLENVVVAAPEGLADESRERAKELLDRFGMTERLTHRPGELSAGERQRVAMARALLNRPKVLLADEPTGNLDPENAAAVLQLVTLFRNEGGTVLLVTHEDQAAAAADRTVLMRFGKLDQQAAVA